MNLDSATYTILFPCNYIFAHSVYDEVYNFLMLVDSDHDTTQERNLNILTYHLTEAKSLYSLT